MRPKGRKNYGELALNLSLTSHTVHMKDRAKIWIRCAVLFLELCLIVAAVAFPLVITEATLANFLKILELIARVG